MYGNPAFDCAGAQIHAVCRRVLGHPEDALDATQEAMIAITRAATSGRRGSHGRTAAARRSYGPIGAGDDDTPEV